MAYTVIITKPAQKQLKKIDLRYQKIISKRLKDLEQDPLLGKKLQDNLSHYRSLREGVYRIIYRVVANKLLIYVIAVSHRQSAYKIK